MFDASRETLLELFADKKYLGAQPGIVSAIHTWGRNLSVHPHIHSLVTAGGVDSFGEFKHSTRTAVLPAKVVMQLFRGKLRSWLLAELAGGSLVLPQSMRANQFRGLMNKLGRDDWNVRVEKQYQDGVSVAGYLARYISGGPISERRLKFNDEKGVTFTYHDYRDGKQKSMTLSPFDFLDRWAEHVPPKGLHAVRYAGLYSNRHAQTRVQLRVTVAFPVPQSGQSRVTEYQPELCPKCGTRVVAMDFHSQPDSGTVNPQRLRGRQYIQPP